MITQKALNQLKQQAEAIGQWAMYLLEETEYWAPLDLEKITPETLRQTQQDKASWIMESAALYPSSGAEEEMRQSLTDQVKDSKNCLTEDEAYELEALRLDEKLKAEKIPDILKQIREKNRIQKIENEIERKLMYELDLTPEEEKYLNNLPPNHHLQELKKIDEM